ncbi:TPA: beta-Ala-His dipeptidase [Klebsiella quasipneumoniae subsp. similipneumoniae]|nr:beta-Ala-His dipeptidase [Klebsiella quasipneumoniae subsp. similipneumoniae]
MAAYDDLEPWQVLKHFKNLSSLPRGSQGEKQVSDYLLSFATSLGLEASQDEMDNILIRKPASPGYESAPALLLHGHMDMVCVKEACSAHDFTKDPLTLKVTGDYIHADRTSLGADNGIGVSYIMALLESNDLPHPALEAVITVMEEMGKAGANKFNVSSLRAKRMVDFNWITDNQLLAGCGGDISCKIDVPGCWMSPMPESQALQVSVIGLSGGHCEFDIHQERANAIILAARLAREIFSEFSVYLANLQGGNQNNVIPETADMLLVLQSHDVEGVRAKIKEFEGVFRSEHAVSDPDLKITISDAPLPERVFSPDAAQRLFAIISIIPNGVISMSRNIDGLVESSCNLGTARQDDQGVSLMSTITAGVSSRKHDIFRRMKQTADLAGGGTKFSQFGLDAPEFPPLDNSVMVAKAVEAYEKLGLEKPEVLVSSCSLELGFFVSRIPGLDTVGIGTELLDIHSPKERVNHRSVAKSWRVVKKFVSLLDK